VQVNVFIVLVSAFATLSRILRRRFVEAGLNPCIVETIELCPAFAVEYNGRSKTRIRH
jgi:hypothetical protein